MGKVVQNRFYCLLLLCRVPAYKAENLQYFPRVTVFDIVLYTVYIKRALISKTDYNTVLNFKQTTGVFLSIFFLNKFCI